MRAWAIEHNNVAYSDHTDRYVSTEHNCETPMKMVVEDMRQSARSWNNPTMITGGSLALHKTPWRLLVWEMVRVEIQLVAATEEVIMMEDGKGAFAAINFNSPDEPNEGLGYRICPGRK